MNKTLKILGLTLAIVFGLLVAGAIALTIIFNPNQYKGQIVQLVKEKTGRDLRIDKKIGWSFFPQLGLEAGGLELSNAPGFGKEPFAKIDAAGVRVAFLPLLHGKIDVNTIYLHGLTLNLAKNAAGKTNWDDLVAAGKEPQAAPVAPAEKGAGKLPIESLSVDRFELRRANIRWHDEAAGSTLALQNLELTTGKFVAGSPTDLNVAFELARDKAAPVKIALKSRVTASSDALKLGNVELKVDDSRLTGGVDVRNFASPAVRFDLALDRIDLDHYLPASPEKPATGTNAPSAAEKPVELPLATLRSLDVNGKLRIGHLKAFNLRSTDVQAQIAARNGLITLGPNQARLYDGNYRGQTVMDVRGKVPQYRLDESLAKVQVGPLLKDMKLFDNYTGTGNIDVKLTAQGFDASQIKQSLNGTANIAFRDGKIEGVDLAQLIEEARALYDVAKGKPVTVKTKASDSTVFKSLTASVQIKNGIAHNNDLKLEGTNLRATGRGSADLVREKLDYHLDVTVAGEAQSKGTTVPVVVGGTFSSPSYNVDFSALLKEEAQKQIEKQLQKGLEQFLQPKKRK